MKISIITVNYNNLKGLKKTFESVFNQKFKDFEYIVIDGGSTDGSAEYIEENKHKIYFWVSEKDKGVYNAMNKGIIKANGEYLLFLNSGDMLYSVNTLQRIIPFFLSKKSIYYGDLVIEIKEKKPFKWIYPSKLSLFYFLENSLPHQATYIKKDVLVRLNFYDENYSIISDWIFTVEAIIKNKESYEKIDDILVIYNYEGISSNKINHEKVYNEKHKYLEQSFYISKEDLSFYKKMIENSNTLNHKRFIQFVQVSKSKFYFEMLKLWLKLIYLFLPKKYKFKNINFTDSNYKIEFKKYN
jgi:glycosyltransferase involved in cell wall biosynthesis